MLNYKGYIGKVEYDYDAHILFGTVVNTKTVITFQSENSNDIEREFMASVDDYLDWCKEDGIDPEKPYSGKLNLRLSPNLHRDAAVKAKLKGVSLNRFIEDAISDELMQG